MKRKDLEREYGVVRYVGCPQFHSREELVFQSDDIGETIQHLETECTTNNAEYKIRVVFKDDNS